MAEKSAERTHKHRNIIDDLFDLGLIIGGMVFFFMDIELDKDTIAELAVGGAALRATLRRILMKIWGPQIEAIEARSNGEAPEPETEPDPEPEGDGVPEAAPEDPTNPDPEPALDNDDDEP